MKDEYTVALNALRAFTCSSGASWSVLCQTETCDARIVGFRNADEAIRGATNHLLWHEHGEPTCRDCGAWLAHRTSRRCRKGRCAA